MITDSMPRMASTLRCSKEGIIDPTKVTRLALENAASIASLLVDY